MRRSGLKRVKRRRGKRGSKRRQSLVKLNSAIQRAISKRNWRAATASVSATTAASALMPILTHVLSSHWTSADLKTILDDTGVGGVALGSSTSKVDSYSIVNMNVKHQFRNLALNPVFLDIWILTPTKMMSYRSTTQATYDSLTEICLLDLYQGWTAHYLSTDVSAGLKQVDGVTAWTGSGSFYSSSDVFVPSTSRDFNKHFRTIKKHSVMLNPGQSFIFNDKAKDALNFYADFDNDLYTLGRPGTARIILVRQRGNIGATAASAFGYCITKVAHTATYTCKVYKENKDTYLTSVGGALSMPAAATDVYGVGEDVGVI